MISLRHFTDADAEAVRARQAPDMTEDQVLSMIRDWNAGSFQGRYFEMFAVVRGDAVVGSVSLYQHSQSVASVGAEIYEPFRGSGFASEAVLLTLAHAKRLGYQIIQDQVRTDNAASIRLHEKLGFETDGTVYRNRKDRPVYLFLKAL